VAQSGSRSKCSWPGATNVFTNSRLLTAANGAQLNKWSKQAVGQKWVNCYSLLVIHDGQEEPRLIP
jgi:hypothetical protein